MTTCCRHDDHAHEAFTGTCAFDACHGPIVRVYIDPDCELLHVAMRGLREEGVLFLSRAIVQDGRPVWKYRMAHH